MKFYFTFAMFFLVSCAQNNTTSFGTVQVDQVGSPQAGICSANFSVTDFSGQQVTFVKLDVLMKDSNQHETHFDFSDPMLASVLHENLLPANGQIAGTITLDLGAKNLSAPATGTLVFTGVSGSGSTQFIGDIACDSF